MVWAPRPVSSPEEWKQLYAPKPTDPPALPSPIVDKIADALAKENDDRLQQEYRQRERDAQVQLGVSPSPEEWEAAERALALKHRKLS